MTEKIFVVSNRNGSLNEHAVAMSEGLKRHGFDPVIVPKGSMPPEGSPFIVCWGWREGNRLREAGHNVLVMERGYIGDRFYWTSLGWNGLNGRATWNAPADKGERFEQHHGHLLKPWKSGGDYALIIGQVRGDAALMNVVIDQWYVEAASALRQRGLKVMFRPHPESIRRKIDGRALLDSRIDGSLEDAFAGASCVVTYNSNTGVDAALAGVPVVAVDEGAMARSVASHGIGLPLVTPDRSEWCRRMAWRQWTPEEIASGLAWEHVGTVMPSLIKASEPDKGRAGRTALVLGGGSNVRSDIEAALKMFTPDLVIAVNDFGAEWVGRLDHWVSAHPEKMAGWIDQRASNGHAPAGRVWTYEHKDKAFPYLRMVNPGGGSSALAVAVAREMGAERIVLAGVPLTSTPHFFDDVPWSSKEVAHYQRAWLRHKKNWIGCVRSLSGGFTEEHYGRPTKEWIEERDVENAA